MILDKIFHPIQSIQKWAIIKVVKGIVKELPLSADVIQKVWSEYSDEIAEKVTGSIENVVVKIFKKALAKQGITFLDKSDN